MKTLLDCSMKDLQRALQKQTKARKKLARDESKLETRLQKVRQRLRTIDGRGGGRSGNGHVPRTRPKNEKSLRDTIEEILTRSPKGFPLAELAKKILASGYKSNSADFGNVVYQCVYNHKNIQHDRESGCYRLKAKK